MKIKTHLSPCHTQVRTTVVKVDHKNSNLDTHQDTGHAQAQDEQVGRCSQGAEPEQVWLLMILELSTHILILGPAGGFVY